MIRRLFAGAIGRWRRDWAAAWLSPPAYAEKRVQSRGPLCSSCTSLEYKDDTGLPAGLPSPRELRILAAHLASQNQPEEALALAQAKRYEVIHELAGYHDAVNEIYSIADTLEEAERAAQDEAQILPRAE